MRRGRPPIDTSVPSPCTAVCRVDKTDQICIGCLRTLDEIRDWSAMTAEQKHQALARIEVRKTERQDAVS